MTKIYLVRHCEAIGNFKKLFQGTTDLDITELGQKQLDFLTKRFEDIHLDCVYSSPLIRTQKTAKAVIGAKGLTPIIHKGLIELDGGILEGKPFLEPSFANPQIKYTWFNEPHNFVAEGGEHMRDAYERIWNAIAEIVKENPNKTVACATHGGVIRCLMSRLYYGDITRLKDVPISSNTAVSLIEFDENLNHKIIFNNDAGHLPDDMITCFSNKPTTEESK